ncbi:hypothetical protein A2164_04485 [Candidatus Curtissbacteria bacterium RBG_13_35_7]|uniref:DNA 3'-5' helicase n=1 Tax=Candidatus Curtissbacteria bacterium RBG_13_35_7 TaxID=1797705 RepID=A0A1F5G0G1_9BACT|nr:MAG: hypothetical protein A2164_04485 [Candidatus Curtissbacteria bacterium RBG_13_35_7]
MTKLLQDLDQYQREAVKQLDGPVLILAGAGSGKTRVLTYKAAYLIDKGIKPENILLSTFTNKAANEMKERIVRLLEHQDFRAPGINKKEYPITQLPDNLNTRLPYVGTFHSYCARLLRIEGKYIGIPSGYLIYDDNDSLSLVKKIMKDLDISKTFRPSSMLTAISQAKSELVDARQYKELARGPFGETVSRIYDIYQKELKKIGACDFDDLLNKTVELFEKYPQILAKYARRYRYVLVDEYQDVNMVQYSLTKQLSSKHKNLTVVGDASQAIYSFRGANFRNILNFETDFPDAKVFNLEQNYRSTKNILNAANSVIVKNTSHPVLNLWTKKKLGEQITIYNAQNELDEANFIVERIIASAKKLSAFAILYRTNAQSRNIEEALLHSNIPYIIYGGIRFYERKEIKDVIAYLRLIENPRDNVSKMRVEKLGKRRYAKFEEMAKKIRNKKKLPLPLELIDKVLETTEYLKLIDDGTEQGLMRVENVKELKSVASDYENLTTLLENIALMEGKVTPDKSYEGKAASDVVTLMTIHAAKGLEFENVFMVGMEEGLFPHSRSMLDPGEIEEERRLAYVGMTRAKQKLYLSYATHRMYFGSTSANLVSRFIVDIPEELIVAV